MAPVKKVRFNITSCTVALGIAWAIYCLLAGWTSTFGWGGLFVKVMSSFYIGYQPGFIGGIIGGVWAFFDGAIFGFLFAFFYNLVHAKTTWK